MTTNQGSNESGENAPWGEIIADLIEGQLSGIMDIINNGFDFSCWGATFTPSDESANIQNHYTPFFQPQFEAVSALASGNNVSAMNNVYNVLQINVKHAIAVSQGLLDANDWSNCSTKGLEMFRDYCLTMGSMLDTLDSQLLAKGWNVETMTTNTSLNSIIQLGEVTRHYNWGDSIVHYPNKVCSKSIVPEALAGTVNGGLGLITAAGLGAFAIAKTKQNED